MNTENQGGQGGGLLAGIGHNRADARMLERAIKERWPIPEKARQALMSRMLQIGLSPDSSNREAVAAARVVLTADGQNQADEHKQQPDELVVSAGERMTTEAQLAAVRAMISAERAKRAHGQANQS